MQQYSYAHGKADPDPLDLLTLLTEIDKLARVRAMVWQRCCSRTPSEKLVAA